MEELELRQSKLALDFFSFSVSREVRSETRILNPIYNKTSIYESHNLNKATPDVLSEGKKKPKDVLTIDTTKNVTTFAGNDDMRCVNDSNDNLDVPRLSEDSDVALEEEKEEEILFITKENKYESILVEYRETSILFLLDKALKLQLKGKREALSVRNKTVSINCTPESFTLQTDRKKFYQPIRHKAISFIKTRLNEMLTLDQVRNSSNIDVSNMLKKVPHSVFSWSFKDFLKRRRLKNTNYVDNFIEKTNLYDANTLKIIVDIRETKKIINKLFECDVSHKKSKSALTKGITSDLSAIKSLLNIEAKLIHVIEAYISADEKDKCVLEHCKKMQIDNNDEQKASLETKLVDVQLWNPIELRYTLNWIQAKQNQCLLNAKEQEKVLSQQIQKVSYEKQLLQMASKSSWDINHTLSVWLQTKINEISNKYQVDYELIDNKNIYLQKKIDFYHVEMKTLALEMERFHENIAAMQCRTVEKKRKRLDDEALNLEPNNQGMKKLKLKRNPKKQT